MRGRSVPQGLPFWLGGCCLALPLGLSPMLNGGKISAKLGMSSFEAVQSYSQGKRRNSPEGLWGIFSDLLVA